MELDFEIIRVHHSPIRGTFIFARLKNGKTDFQVNNGATLGGLPVYPNIEIPRLLDESGKPRFDVFIFRPLSPQLLPAGYFTQGQQVKLVSPD